LEARENANGDLACREVLAEGKRVAVLSRGYRGNGKTSDEIELMKDRLQGGVLFGVARIATRKASAWNRLKSTSFFSTMVFNIFD